MSILLAEVAKAYNSGPSYTSCFFYSNNEFFFLAYSILVLARYSSFNEAVAQLQLICNSWTHTHLINSAPISQPRELCGTQNKRPPVVFAAMCYPLPFLFASPSSFNHCPWWLGQDLGSPVGSQCDFFFS